MRLPQQYAHPLPQRGDSTGSQSSGSRHRGPSPSEHMLRRKTPNGVLSEAYDGTAVSQTDRPHPLKHIILPVDESTLNAPLMAQPPIGVERPAQRHTHNYTTDTLLGSRHLHPQNQVWDPGVKGGFGPDGWIPGQNNPQIDSMLNQIPMQHHLQQSPDHYGFMQPSMNQSGPTISNSMGPYGPYWPNGDFVPYRLAAFRDPRYNVQYTPQWRSPNFPSGFHGPLERYDTPVMNQQLLVQPTNRFPMAPPQVPSGYGPLIHATEPLSYPKSAQPNKSLDYFGKQSPTTDDSGEITPRANQTPNHDFGQHSLNFDGRERVFSWAHSVYINLLDFLRHARRAASNNRQMQGYHHAQRPNIYPKPPRQQNYDFQTHLLMRRSGDRGDKNAAIRPQQAHAFSTPVDNQTFQVTPAWPSQHVHMTPEQRQGSWQTGVGGAGPYVASSDRMHPLRRGSAPSGSISSLPSPVHGEQSPTATAISALDALERSCQESNWKWVEGILLGGCLAYALSDYNKAKRWYATILELDAK